MELVELEREMLENVFLVLQDTIAKKVQEVQLQPPQVTTLCFLEYHQQMRFTSVHQAIIAQIVE